MIDFRLHRHRQAASDKQVAYLRFLAEKRGLRPADLDAWLRGRWGVVADDLDNVTCSWLIDEVREWRGAPNEAWRAP